MKLLTKEALGEPEARPKTTRVPVPELGGEVVVRGLTGTERDAYEVACHKMHFEGQPLNVRGLLVAMSWVDDSGARVWTDQEAPVVGAMRADILDRLFAAAQRLTGLRARDLKALGEASA